MFLIGFVGMIYDFYVLVLFISCFFEYVVVDINISVNISVYSWFYLSILGYLFWENKWEVFSMQLDFVKWREYRVLGISFEGDKRCGVGLFRRKFEKKIFRVFYWVVQ